MRAWLERLLTIAGLIATVILLMFCTLAMLLGVAWVLVKRG